MNRWTLAAVGAGIEGGSRDELVEVALTRESLLGAEPLPLQCEGLGQMLGLEVDVVTRVAEEGRLVAERLDLVSD